MVVDPVVDGMEANDSADGSGSEERSSHLGCGTVQFHRQLSGDVLVERNHPCDGSPIVGGIETSSVASMARIGTTAIDAPTRWAALNRP